MHTFQLRWFPFVFLSIYHHLSSNNVIASTSRNSAGSEFYGRMSSDVAALSSGGGDDSGRAAVDQCVPVDIAQCKRWYDQRTPHNIYASTTSEMNLVKNIVANLELLENSQHTKCVNDATFLLCSLYSPVCIEHSKLVLKPCRELCVGWKRECYRLPTFSRVALPDKLRDCKELPEHHNSICIQPNTFFTKEQENKKIKTDVTTDGNSQQNCNCKDFKESEPKYRHFRKASYVFEATINTRETLANGNTKIILNVQKIYKLGKLVLKLGKLRMWSSCLCHKDINYGDKYILLVNESTTKKKKKKKNLEVDRSTFILPYAKYKMKLKRWREKCVKRKNCYVT